MSWNVPQSGRVHALTPKTTCGFTKRSRMRDGDALNVVFDPSFMRCNMSRNTASRTTAATVVFRRAASDRSHASRSGGNRISCRIISLRSRGIAMKENIDHVTRPVKFVGRLESDG